MNTKFTVENVTAAMRAAVARNGSDYVYDSDTARGAGCYYSQRDAGGVATPSCIVGHVINDIDPDLFEKVAKFEDISGGSSLRITGMPREFPGLNMPYGLLVSLSAAQTAQDIGDPWGMALKKYEVQLATHNLPV